MAVIALLESESNGGLSTVYFRFISIFNPKQ